MSQVPIVKIFTMGDCMAAQRRCENSSFEHAHYGALRCVTCAYRPVKGVGTVVDDSNDCGARSNWVILNLVY